MSSKTYVSERVVNIKELEDYISGAFTMVLCIQKELQNESPDFQNLKSLSDEAVEKLQKAHTFEFCVERRKTIG